MSKRLKKISSFINIIVGLVVFISVFETRHYFWDYGHGAVLSTLRCILSHFVLACEIPVLQPSYLEHFKFYMFPRGRSLMYVFLSLATFNVMWYGLINFFIIIIMALVTFIISLFHKENRSPYMLLDDSNLPDQADLSNSNPQLAYHCYQSIAHDEYV